MGGKHRRPAPILLAALLLLATPARAGGPISTPGPDAAAYGAPTYPSGTRATVDVQPTMVGAYSHYDALFPSHLVRHTTPIPWRRAPAEPTLTYTYQGATHTLDDYLARHPTTALLVARGDTILLERYQYGRTENDRLLSQSMAKTVTALLIGAAIADGRIRSIDDPAQTYATTLTHTLYGETPLRALLTMSSGVQFREDYTDPSADNTQLGRDLRRRDSPGPAAALARLHDRAAPPGTRFSYAGADTETLGLVLRAATGMSLADNLSARLWQPMGAESDANWSTDATGQELAYCCLSATARDWARLGLLMANDGVANGQPLIPKAWITAMTRPDREDLAPGRATRFDGYGYQTWLLPGNRGAYAFRGIHGQAIFVDPQTKLVMVHTAVRLLPNRDPATAELAALWQAAVAQLGAR